MKTMLSIPRTISIADNATSAIARATQPLEGSTETAPAAKNNCDKRSPENHSNFLFLL
jgi:hypothetical protein